MRRPRTNRTPFLRFSSTFVAVSAVWLIFGGLRPSAQALRVVDQPVDTASRDTPRGSTPPVRHLTLAQAQQVAAQATDLPAKLAQLGVEAAEQQRLVATADYFPKFDVAFWNLHYNKFMGQEITLSRPIIGRTFTTALPLIGQDQTFIDVNAIQPITPLLKVRQAVRVARADENIARAKAGMAVVERRSALEKTYFDLLVAQKQLALLDASVRKPQAPRRVAGTAAVATNVSESKPDTPDANELPAVSERVTALTASLNALLGWPAETPLELEPPAPLVEHLSLHEALDQALTTNPEVIEAEQTVRKAEAAAKVSKLAYIPDFAVFGGYAYESNVIPLLPTDFSYIGVMGTYNLFDSGKREHTMKARTVQVHMAQTALALTKAKVAAAVQESYVELDRSRALADIAHRLETLTYRADVADSTDDVDTQMASARLSLELLQLDFHHRQALAKLEAIMTSSTR